MDVTVFCMNFAYMNVRVFNVWILLTAELWFGHSLVMVKLRLSYGWNTIELLLNYGWVMV